jgi:hypothetical protein
MRPTRFPETEPSGRRRSAPHAVAIEAPHAVAADGTHAVTGDDPMRSPRPPPVEIDAKGQALSERLRAFRTQAW